MKSLPVTRLATTVIATLASAALIGCGSSAESGSTSTSSPEPDEPIEVGPEPVDPPSTPSCGAGEEYISTFEAVQRIVFERNGCTADVCHGGAAAGGLDLSADVAYQNLVDVPSSGSSLLRVRPGDKAHSLLWLKLAEKTDPENTDYDGAPMPSGLPAITLDELDLVRWWIYAGAPESGTVAGTESLVDGCLPPAEPQPIAPLAAPTSGTGIQFQLPEFPLPAASELEYCYATYYDVSDQVPEKFQDPTGTSFYFGGQELRMDAQSHHVILNLASIGVDELDDPSFGNWLCRGGERSGDPCNPTDLAFCGAGLCASDPQPSFACIGYGPRGAGAFGTYQPIGGAQQPVAVDDYPDGVFAQLPMKGVLYWNPHAFNLSAKNTALNGRMNYYFASQRDYRVRAIFDTSAIFAANAAPYTKQTVCNDHVLPQGARLFQLNSHTHKFGERFTIELTDGTQLYESFTYNDPVDKRFDPPLAFDSTDANERTLRYCAVYNNGVTSDGLPDPQTVTRLSRMPDGNLGAGAVIPATCTPVACAAGRIGDSCDGADDHATCDSSPGDGDCDACRITGGETTETEMFILLGGYYVDPSGL